MTMAIVDPSGSPTNSSADYQNIRNRFEKRLQEYVMKLAEEIRDSPVARPDVNAILDRYDKQWGADCEVAAKSDVVLEREAFRTKVKDMLAQLKQKRMFNGPISPEALQLLGFRKWSDGTWRSNEVVLTPIGTDWRITITQDIVGNFHLPMVLGLTHAAGIKSITPFNEPKRRTWLARFLNR